MKLLDWTYTNLLIYSICIWNVIYSSGYKVWKGCDKAGKKVQKVVAKIFRELLTPYEEKVECLGLFSLEKVEMYKSCDPSLTMLESGSSGKSYWMEI